MITFQQLGRHGQLGNQMFQYALILAVAEKNGFEFGVPYRQKSDDKFLHFALPDGFRYLSAKDSSGRPIKHRYGETDADPWTFRPAVYDVQDDTNFSGYYQTEKYFLPYREQIIDEFMPPGERQELVREFLRKIIRERIFVHVRRGDALTNGSLSMLGRCYFERAVEHFPASVHFIVLTDDKEWCRENLKMPYLSFSPFTDKFDDLELMRQCDGGIVHNSTFSWWGAWLGDESRKIVGPNNWSSKHPCGDVLASNWIGV